MVRAPWILKINCIFQFLTFSLLQRISKTKILHHTPLFSCKARPLHLHESVPQIPSSNPKNTVKGPSTIPVIRSLHEFISGYEIFLSTIFTVIKAYTSCFIHKNTWNRWCIYFFTAFPNVLLMTCTKDISEIISSGYNYVLLLWTALI